jgi:DNA-binding MarR family transcriptional regulator
LDTDTLYAFAVEARTLVAMLAKTSGQALDRRLSKAEPQISGLQYLILRALSSGQQTLADLSRAFARTPSTLVPAINALERKSLVTRGQDPHDRRRIPVDLTPRGRKLLDDVPYVHPSDPLVQGLQAMGEEQMSRLLALLCEWVIDLPGGRERVQQVEAEVRMHAQPAGKEGAKEKDQRELVCQYCRAPDGFEPCPRRRITNG